MCNLMSILHVLYYHLGTLCTHIVKQTEGQIRGGTQRSINKCEMATAGKSKIEKRDQWYVNILLFLYCTMQSMFILLKKTQRIKDDGILTTHTLILSKCNTTNMHLTAQILELFTHNDMQFCPVNANVKLFKANFHCLLLL